MIPPGRAYLGALRPEDVRSFPSGVSIRPPNSEAGSNEPGGVSGSIPAGRGFGGAPSGTDYMDGRFPGGKASAANTPPWMDRAVAGVTGSGEEGSETGSGYDHSGRGEIDETGQYDLQFRGRGISVRTNARRGMADRIIAWIYQCDVWCPFVQLVTQKFADEVAL